MQMYKYCQPTSNAKQQLFYELLIKNRNDYLTLLLTAPETIKVNSLTYVISINFVCFLQRFGV